MAISSRVAEEGTRKQSGTLRKPPPDGVGRLPTVLLQLEERGRGACTGEAVGRVSEEQRRCFLVVKVHLFELVPLAGGILSLVQIVQVLVSQPLRQLNVAQLPVFELEGQPHWHLAATEPSAGSQSTRPETRKQAGPLQQAAALHVAASARARTHRHARAKSVLALRERNLDRHLGLEGAEAAGEEMDLLEREVRRDFHQLILCHRHNSARTASGHTVTRGMRAAAGGHGPWQRWLGLWRNASTQTAGAAHPRASRAQQP